MKRIRTPSSITATIDIINHAMSKGFRWQKPIAVIPKLREEVNELESAMKNREPAIRQQEEWGDVFFTTLCLAAEMGIAPGVAIAKANQKFNRRFRTMLKLIKNDSKITRDLSPKQWDNYWQKAKTILKKNP